MAGILQDFVWLKSLWVTKESPQTGHLRKKVVFYKSCVFSYIGKTKKFSGRFGDVHCNDFFQNTKLVSGLLIKMFKNGKNDLGTFKKT